MHWAKAIVCHDQDRFAPGCYVASHLKESCTSNYFELELQIQVDAELDSRNVQRVRQLRVEVIKHSQWSNLKYLVQNLVNEQCLEM